MKRLSSTKERYKAERIKERADLCPTPILILKKEKEKLF